MPKDYAKSKKLRSNSRSRVIQGKSTTGLWLLTGILIGLFIAGLAYLNNHRPNVNPNVEVVKNSSPKPVKQHLSNKEKVKSTQPKFDFYTILPKMKVWVPTNNEPNLPVHKPSASSAATTAVVTKPTPPPPAEVINIPVANPPMPNKEKEKVAATKPKVTDVKTPVTKPVQTSKANTRYLLQVASMKSYHEADQLKAQLLLMGFNVTIKPTKSNHKTLNRVWVGPYKNSAEAAKVKQTLAEQHIKSILVKMKG